MGLSGKVARAGDALIADGDQAGGVVLDHRRDGDDGDALPAGGDALLLHRDAELRPARGHCLRYAAGGGFDDLHFQPDLPVPALCRGHVDPSVVGVGRPVQHESDLTRFSHGGLLGAGGEGELGGAGESPDNEHGSPVHDSHVRKPPWVMGWSADRSAYFQGEASRASR